MPLLACAPMLNIATARLAISVPAAGGLGFLANRFDVSTITLENKVKEAVQLIRDHTLLFNRSTRAPYQPCVAWLFAPRYLSDDFRPWVNQVRAVTDSKTKIWVQVGTVAEAVAVMDALGPDVLAVQGYDAGGHGLAQSASIIDLVPEVRDALSTRQARKDTPLLAAGDIARFSVRGGVSTVRSAVYNRVREILDQLVRYDGHGLTNQSYIDALSRYKQKLKKGGLRWGPKA
ncbi:hypothetical protein BJX70DRAFT_390799 [Aspergillus crustosus]